MSSKFVFSAETSTGGRELWVTDGTPEGTHLLADINPDGSSNPGSFYFQNEGGNIVSTPADLGSLGDGRALFDADDGTHGVELWTSDGTAEGTHSPSMLGMPCLVPMMALKVLSFGRLMAPQRARVS
jgi:ELWxxDGT repeat protein